MDLRGAIDIRGDPSAVEKLRREGSIRGYVLRGETGGKVSLVPQARRTRPGKPAQMPLSAIQQMAAGIPPQIQRPARERYKALVTRLINDAMKMKAQYGKVIFPTSVQAEIKRLAWLEGDPTLPQRIERGATDAIEKYAGSLMRKAAHQQREKDRHKTTADWHQHYNDTIYVGGQAANLARSGPKSGLEPGKE